MILYHKRISSLLETRQYAIHKEAILYYVCNLLYLKNIYFKQFGAIQLGSFRAEAILEDISAHFDSLADKIGNTNLSLISNLGDDKITFQQFEVNLSLNKTLVDNFFNVFFTFAVLLA